jgi:PAS domain S-box-containing protein
MPDLLQRLRRLPSNTIILLTSIGQDAARTSFKSNESSPLIIGAANVPVFSLFDVHLNYGEVGGYLSSLSKQGKVAGDMALRLLRGEKASQIPRVRGVNTYMFDWRALKRWGLKESALPPGSMVINREPTVWDSYKWYIISGISLILFEALLIGGLVWQRARRRKAETDLAITNDRLRLAATAGKMFAYEWDVATDKVVRSEEHIKVLGFGDPAKQLTRQQVLARVHPDDRALFVASVDQLTPQYPTTQISYRVLRPDGSVVWLEKNARGFFDEQGKLLRVIGMMANITERKRAEEALRESEEQFRTLAEAIPQLCWMAHGDGHIFRYNQRWYTYTGTTPEQMEGWGWQSVHDPQALPLVLERWKTSIATGEPFDMVFPMKAADSIFHPFLTRIMPVKDSKRSVVRWFGTNTDVTELRNAQEALSEMSRKLVQAQEQERARIARELHDDINQRLAMLGIELERLQDNPSEVRSRVQELRKQTTEISNDVQALSHDLHSSQLEYLGAVRGMKSWCKEFGERQGLQIEFKSPDAQISLPKEIGLCLFRVLQEALHNAAKHSGVRRIEVQLREDSGEIHLVVSDLGRGFDWETAMQGRGLGLTSMRERVRLVSGIVEIQSKPMCGTTVHVRVPVGSGADSIRAAG